MTAPALVTLRPFSQDLPARLLPEPSLGRCLLVAIALHLLLVWSVGTDSGGGRGSGTRSGDGTSPLLVRLQGVSPAPPALPSPDLGAGSPTGGPEGQAPGAGAPRLPRDAAAAVVQQPRTAVPAGQAEQGVQLRGLDSGLPAAPSLADLQSPPTGRAGPAAPVRPAVAGPVETPQRPQLLSVPDRGAQPGTAPVPAVTTTVPEPVRAPPDASPARPAALVEAERPQLPRADEPTQGVVEGTRKLSAAPEPAVRDAPAADTARSAVARVPADRGLAAPDRAAASAEPRPVVQEVVPSAQADARQAPPALVPVVPTTPAAPPVTAPLPVPPPLAVPSAPAPVVAPAPTPAAAPVAMPAARSEAAMPAAGVSPAPGSLPPAAGSGARGSPGRAGDDAASRGLVSIPAPPLPPASAPRPALNLELPRAAGAAPARSPPAGAALKLELPPQDARSRLSRDIEKSGRGDCRTAHADKGLFGAAFLAADALRRDGCKW